MLIYAVLHVCICISIKNLQDAASYNVCVFTSIQKTGFSRRGDRRWITQYVALPEAKLLHGGIHHDCHFQMLDPISQTEKHTPHGKVLTEFNIDNCCSWQKKLQVFGEQLMATWSKDKVPKQHPLLNQCLREW